MRIRKARLRLLNLDTAIHDVLSLMKYSDEPTCGRQWLLISLILMNSIFVVDAFKELFLMPS